MTDRLDLRTPDFVNENIEKLAALFPHCVTETAEGKKIDFDLLQQELSHDIVEGNRERYRLEWPGKREAIVTANLPTTKTLRPVRDDSVDFDNTENLYIEGDNLEVLKLLQESYFGKIKMIYIDPPYNTGTNMIYSNDYSISKDDFLRESGQIEDGYQMVNNPKTDGRFHSRWLSMMYPRLKLARNLLTDDGFIVLAMDDSEIENLIKLCDEVLGEGNRIGVVTVVHKPEGRNQEKFFGTSNEFALFYAKNKQVANFNNVILDAEKMAEFQFVDAVGKYKKKNFIRRADGKYATREAKPKFWYPIYVSRNLQDITLQEKDGYYEVYPIIDNGVERTWKTLPETFLELYNNGQIIAEKEDDKIIISEKMRENQVVKTHWIKKEYHAYHFGTKILDELLSNKTFDFPKSLYLMIDILKLCVENNDIILDFFSGSATTAHAVMQLNAEDGGNRKFIMVQLPEQTDEKSEAYKAGYKNICEIGKERIRRAGAKLAPQPPKGGAERADSNLFSAASDGVTPSHPVNKLDIGFRVYRLADSNMQDVYYRPQDYKQETLNMFADNIKPDRTADDLLAQVMLDWGLPLSYRIEQIDINGKQVFRVAQDSLMACFDKGIDEAFAKVIAKEKPLRVVFRDSGFASDTAKINVQQLLKQLSPETEMKVI